jgi:hypothetical protein
MHRIFLFAFLLLINSPVFSQPKAVTELNKEVKSIVSKYPVPHLPNLLFYLQRNKNSNTIVYEANLLADGKLDPRNPVSVYWMRYQEDSSRRELNWIQRWLAYGIDFEPAKDGSGHYILSPVALKHRKITLSLDEKGKPVATMKLNGKASRVKRIYAMAEETSWLPTVKYVQMKGEELQSREEVYEYLFPKQNKVVH